MNFLRAILAGFVAYLPAHYLPKYLFDKKTQFWLYEASFFVIFLVVYSAAIYLMRVRVPSGKSNT